MPTQVCNEVAQVGSSPGGSQDLCAVRAWRACVSPWAERRMHVQTWPVWRKPCCASYSAFVLLPSIMAKSRSSSFERRMAFTRACDEEFSVYLLANLGSEAFSRNPEQNMSTTWFSNAAHASTRISVHVCYSLWRP